MFAMLIQLHIRKTCIQIMHFRSGEQFLKVTIILKFKNKGNFRGLFGYSAGKNDTSQKYFWYLYYKNGAGEG